MTLMVCLFGEKRWRKRRGKRKKGFSIVWLERKSGGKIERNLVKSGSFLSEPTIFFLPKLGGKQVSNCEGGGLEVKILICPPFSTLIFILFYLFVTLLLRILSIRIGCITPVLHPPIRA
jgi:hypothetical protein